MSSHMLDTNTVSSLVRGNAKVLARIRQHEVSAICISSITEGELRYGLAKRPDATSLHLVVNEFLRRAEVMPWDTDAARAFGFLRATMERKGKSLGAFDMLIAAHALSIDAVLVSNDKAFRFVPNLVLEDWTK